MEFIDNKNRLLDIPFMEAKGAYHVIAEILGLEHQGQGIFIEKSTGNKFLLTKYGFREAVQYNTEIKIKELEKKVEKSKVRHEQLNNRVANQKKEISKLYDKLENCQEDREMLSKKLNQN